MKRKTFAASTLFAVVALSSSSSTPPAAFPASGNGLSTTQRKVCGLKDSRRGGHRNSAVEHLNFYGLENLLVKTYLKKLPNETTATHLALERIRASLFANATGDVYPLTSPFPFYGMTYSFIALRLIKFVVGSYVGAGHLITMNVSDPATDFARWLDLDEGVARTTWTQSSSTFIRCVSYDFQWGAEA
ncbi:hypothetical protein BT96DRAFT_1003939 [Gymnopus androsaceus JB14]|uniref:Glycosyl hydrolase family 95 N-terminal domain-containing protein n=1 Tax=Gymnopus androsaceus JB14 TaxID=1447944 RepID=A0A6A4GTJ0_9AGAR|nr:hypothetical protein BT96DRAFT_1003939 [Gymnopus androsaceus JB14]